MSHIETMNFSALLWNVVRAEQLAEAEDLASKSGMLLQDALVKLGYVSNDQVKRAEAHSCNIPYLDLTDITIPPAIIELIPESVARECVVLPLGGGGRVLFVVISDPEDTETIQKLQFILNRDIQPVVSPREQIIEAINRHYGLSETESVDSFLAEFTDTAIDFTETEQREPVCLPDLQLACFAQAATPRPARLVERQATVRYYHRMNPERTFPLLVVLSRKKIMEAVKRNVSQASSSAFQVALDSVVEVEPILPGCSCYPPREQMPVREEEVSTTFWVVPHVLGQVMQPRVVVRQNGKVLAEVPIEVRVVKQGLTVLLGALSLVLPLVLLLLKKFGLDFESQSQEGFALYSQLLQWMIDSLSPEMLGGMLLAATFGAYLWLRPRKRDVFWDIETCSPDAPADTPAIPSTGGQPDMFRQAEECFLHEAYQEALTRYEYGLRQGKARPVVYFRASLAAGYLGDNRRALEILEEAREKLHPSQISGAMWYNMGCFAARLGRFAEAVRYLNRAADAGHDDPEKYLHDPDVAALRCRPDFKRLLRSLQEC